MADAFEKYAKFGKTEAQVKEMKGGLRIEQRNVQKMMKESGVVDSKYTSQLLDNDMAKALAQLTNEGKAAKGVKTFDKEGMLVLIAQIAKSKNTNPESIKAKIEALSGPSTSGTTGTANASNVARMTDTSNYTGSHKERFDESGKGKGADGRTDKVDNSGYVGNYKGAGTFDKK